MEPMSFTDCVGDASEKRTSNPPGFASATARPPCLAARSGGRHDREDETLVRAEGLEPPRLAAPDPKSGASANSATPASLPGDAGL